MESLKLENVEEGPAMPNDGNVSTHNMRSTIGDEKNR